MPAVSGANAKSMGPQISGRMGGMYLFRLSSLAVSACIIYSINIIIIVNSVPSRKYKMYKYSERCFL